MAIRQIAKITEDTFTIDTFGLYAISITARCKSGKQLGVKGGENLRIEIDDIKLREVPPLDNKQYFDIPSAWNGSDLKGLAKTIIFLLSLNKGDHILTFIPDPSATIESYTITPIQDPQSISFDFDAQAENGDRRPWYTFALIDLPLQLTSADITIAWHSLDGDDVKLMFNGDVMENLKSKRWKNWIWHADPKQVLSGVRREKKEFSKQLSKGIHYIEFWADKTPTLHNVTLNLGDYTPKRVPTVDDPEWTGDFTDDTEQMLLARIIFGEVADQSKKVKTCVGWSIKNRIGKGEQIDPSKSYEDYYDVILDEDQYESLSDPDVLLRLQNPLSLDLGDQEAWFESYQIAKNVFQDLVSDPTEGALFFHDDSMTREEFLKAVPRAVYIKKIGSILFYGL